jgi:hypothetical protein
MSREVETSLTVRERNANSKRFDSFVSRLTRRYPRRFAVYVARSARPILGFTTLRSVSLGMTRSIAATFLLCAVAAALAQEPPTAVPSPTALLAPTLPPTPSPTRSLRISFVPPPIEGTISLGIYDPGGKLVRVLHRESETDDFTIGHDALITDWDGKDDAGQDLPAGKYDARGYMVGALAIEGIDYFFNDWVTEENTPHLKHIDNISFTGSNLRLTTMLASGERVELLYDPANDTMTRSQGSSSSTDSVQGKDGTHWSIGNGEIQQLSPSNDVLRRLAYQATDPQPKVITASDREDRIFVLDENGDLQRVRGLTLLDTKVDAEKQQSVSDWKVDFEKKIVAHKDFSLENGTPVATGGKPTPDKITLRLQPNPLKRDKAGSVEVSVGFDQDGSYLKTSDGLPLRTISDTPNLSRALLVLQSEKAIDVFQDDGAVVEQYRISGVDAMMAFDCGSFELK